MTLITGPAFQGKLEYSKKHWPESIENYFDGETCDYALAKGADVINNYHHLIRRLLDKSIDPVAYTDELIRINPCCVVIMNDIGSGVIPIEKKDRVWREAVGRCGCLIAEHADRVIRVMCGIPTALKGELP